MSEKQKSGPPEPCPKCEGPLVECIEVGDEYICLNCYTWMCDDAYEVAREAGYFRFAADKGKV